MIESLESVHTMATFRANSPPRSGKRHSIGQRHTSSQTPGHKKDKRRCQTNPQKKFFATRSRACRTRGYGEWCRQMDFINRIER